MEIKEDLVGAASSPSSDTDKSTIAHIIEEIFYSPMNLCLLSVIIYLLYKIIRDRTEVPGAGTEIVDEPELPKMRRDFTVKDLRAYDGTQPDGRVLVAVNGSVYDVTKGKRFYGPGGPYATFAGRDASRNLATFSVEQNSKDEYDDLSDLTPMEMESVIEWELQFKEKYDYVGKLLRENEKPTNYDDDEEEEEQDENTKSTDGLRKRDVHKETDVAAKAADAVDPKGESESNETLKAGDASAENYKSASTIVGSTDC